MHTFIILGHHINYYKTKQKVSLFTTMAFVVHTVLVHIQDLKKGGAKPITREACVQIFSHAPKW